MEQQREMRTSARDRVLQHLQVTVGIAERENGLAADVSIDADRLARAVIDEINLRHAHERGLTIAKLELDNLARTDHLLGRNAVRLLRPRTHELGRAA